MTTDEEKTCEVYLSVEKDSDFENSTDSSPGTNEDTRCLRGRPLQVASVLAACIIGLGFGTEIGWTSAVAPELNAIYSADAISWIVTANLPTALLGSLIWGAMTRRFGPKISSFTVGIPMFLSYLFLLKIDILWYVLVGRAFGGLAMGGTISAIPHYNNEIAEDALRGALGAIMVVNFNVGILAVYAMGGFLSSFYVAAVCASIPVVFLILFFHCPESPIHLLTHGYDNAGQRNLRKLRYPRDISDELACIYSSRDMAHGQKAGWVDIVRERAARKALLISMILFMILQISGITPVLSYAGNIFEKSGGSLSSAASSCVVASVQIVGSLLVVLLMDKAGRRPLMLTSCFVMAASHGVLGYALLEYSNAPAWLPVVSLSTFMIAYSSAGGCSFVIANELCSPSVRGRVCSVCVAFNGLLAFVVTKTYSDLTDLIGANGVFWLYAGGCLAGGILVFFVLPETSRRSNASVQNELEGGRSKLTTP